MAAAFFIKIATSAKLDNEIAFNFYQRASASIKGTLLYILKTGFSSI